MLEGDLALEKSYFTHQIKGQRSKQAQTKDGGGLNPKMSLAGRRQTADIPKGRNRKFSTQAF